MSPVRPLLASILSLVLLADTALADTIFLKNGEKIEGTVTQETPEELTLAVKVSAGITDERVIKRGEIDRIEKVSPDLIAYQSIAAIQLGANSVAASQYDSRLMALDGFLKQYPNSPHAAGVKKALDEFVAEKKRVEAGEVKLRGQWMSKAEVEKEKLQINGMIAYEHMKAQSAANDGIGALNTFTVIEKSYAGAATFPESIELARQIIGSLRPALERAVTNQKALHAEKERGFAEASPTDRVEMKAAYKREQEQAEATVKATETAKQWPPFIAASEKSLTALIAKATSESTRLAALPVDKMKQSIQAANLARQKIADGETAAATTALKEATTLWPANELAIRLTKEAAAQLQPAPAAAAAPATPPPKPDAPKAATPKPATTTPQSTAPVAAAQEEKKPFYLTLPGMIAIIVGIAAILAGLNVFKKMQARKSRAE
jgi:hypothetical protein